MKERMKRRMIVPKKNFSLQIKSLNVASLGIPSSAFSRAKLKKIN